MRVAQRFERGPLLPAAADVLALVLADRATVRLARTVRELRAAGDAGETGHATPLIEGKANGSSASWFPRDPISGIRSEEHTSELQSLMRTSYAVFCLKT